MLSKENGKELKKYIVNYVIIDIETTGFSYDKDEIIEISAIRVRNEKAVEEYNSYIKPNKPISSEISKLVGITDSMVELSPDVGNVLTGFLDFIGDDILVCHNAEFDFGFLNKAAMDRFRMVIGNDYIDTYKISKKRLSNHRSFTLSSLADYYGINVEEGTDSLSECLKIKNLLECLFHRRKARADGIIELHCHTKLSKKRGLIDPDDLIRYAYDKGYKAIAITDRDNVQAFPKAYRTWQKMWNEYEEGCRQIGEEADKNDFLKVIYGLEGNLLSEDGNVYPVLLYAKDKTGIKNLYKIVTSSDLEYYDKLPLIPRKYLDEHREGLIVGSACDGGEVFKAVNSAEYDSHLGIYPEVECASYYDFLEMVPYDFINGEHRDSFTRYLCYGAVNATKRPMLVSSDAYYINDDDKTCWDILTDNGKGYCKRPRHLTDYDEECKKMFLDSHIGSQEILREFSEKLFEYRTLIVEQIEYVNPLREGRFLPEYPNAEEELKNICNEKVYEFFGEKPNFEVRKRLERELNSICDNGFAGMFLMWRKIVSKSLELGYPVGARGSVASSLVAYLCGITEINPLSPESGGYHIPVEVFMGFYLDKEPDIDINFSPVIQETIQNYIKEIPGVGETCHAGTISLLTEKNAETIIDDYCKTLDETQMDDDTKKKCIKMMAGVKKGDGVHPGGIIVCPEDEELISFTPLTHPYFGDKIISQFEYYDIWDNLLKLDILGHDKYELLHFLQENTGVRIEDIPLDDEKTLASICDVNTSLIEDLPEFGSEYVRKIISETTPKSFDDLVKISALSHGSDVWNNNQDELVKNKIIKLKDCISSRDDIMIYLMDHDLSKKEAFQIMESVRKGRGINYEQKKLMTEVPDWYINACEKIKYLFPKAHCVSYTMLAVRLAFYKLYYPEAYQEGISLIR